ncbi:MAG: HEAT repeat domain-containing protein [Chloroflexi bacterium]|nr:HEAT repeat domain-containing protein [Chloroflexota bacterium]
MTVRDVHLSALHQLGPAGLEAYLRGESRLPGPRANLELLDAAVEVGDAAEFAAWRAAGAGGDGDDPATFVLVCGLVGLGRVVAEQDAGGRTAGLAELHAAAGDARWRVREGVAMALQRLGRVDPRGLLVVARAWAAEDDPLLRRAAIAALAEPSLLVDQAMAAGLIEVLATVTDAHAAVQAGARRSPGSIALAKTLGYAWSVAVVADPAAGWPAFERVATAARTDPGLRRIVRENLAKNRLARLDPVRVAALAAFVSG